MIIPYSRDMDIRNTDQLPRGTGGKYLLCIKGLEGELIASHWKRKKPAKMSKQEVLIVF